MEYSAWWLFTAILRQFRTLYYKLEFLSSTDIALRLETN